MHSVAAISPLFFSLATARLFTVYNACPFTIWPAVWTNTSYGNAFPLVEGGWEAPTNTSKQFAVPGKYTHGHSCEQNLKYGVKIIGLPGGFGGGEDATFRILKGKVPIPASQEVKPVRITILELVLTLCRLHGWIELY